MTTYEDITARSIMEYQETVHAWACEQGWWDGPERNFGELMLLIASEVVEAFEEYRDNHEPSEIYYRTDKHGQQKPEGIPIELADVFIRLVDACARYGIDLEAVVQQKMAYNRTRPYRHGGKRA